jgi:small-conductance mechanosensitive channel
MDNQYIQAGLIVIAGFVIGKLLVKSLIDFITDKFQVKNGVVIQRVLFYGIMIIFSLASLHQLGFELGVILGAAGIFSVAIGFASQTSMSNVISGLFLLGERAFAIGDFVKINNTTGEIIAIDWLSVKLRTGDNQYVRIPNEMIIKSEMTNITRFKIRRFDCYFSIAYKEDIALVQKLLLQLVKDEVNCLIDPEPMVLVEGFGDSGVNLRLAVWAKSEEFIKFKSNMLQKVKKVLDDNHIEIPFPHMSLYAGEASKPIQFSMVASNSDKTTS